ncbi:DNA-binding MarR family transcriptional regulator [Paraburkholderia bannensis]|uniref:DNA-binding MarR family transcriptional regulator n=1 Tax=Paraburkholderia bannensis TaxID=765414 RepID=A0A7W9U380_9BURK|nr:MULTISPECIES: MarR family transcriptional regulator [Paraburkholderia]MBB3261067.1 DNA-binding MarR family transcriptional regulator [Paraburkholderia sp. WP4_3_2]MBB6106104.1 DNA-binding MarR family transcriptional regulator [Paraburkholderia bannensis]
MNPPSPAESVDLAALAGQLRVSVGKLLRRVREHSQSDGLSAAQKSVLLQLERGGPATVSALARAEGVKPQSMRITVAALEAQGAVKGKADPHDGRQTLIDTTPKFRKALQASRAAKEDWLVRALQTQLCAREQAQLAATVGLLQRLADF